MPRKREQSSDKYWILISQVPYLGGVARNLTVELYRNLARERDLILRWLHPTISQIDQMKLFLAELNLV